MIRLHAKIVSLFAIALLGMGVLAVLVLPKATLAEAQGNRRLLLECPDFQADEFAVELGEYRSDIPLDTIADVCDEQDRSVPWKLSQNRRWLVFQGSPGKKYDIVIQPNTNTTSNGNRRSLRGMLTLKYGGVWVRKGGEGARMDWLCGRIARLAGAVLESRGRDELDRAIAVHRERLNAIGVQQINPAPPFELERELVKQQPDFALLLEQVLDADLQARAEIFVTAKRVLGYHRASPSTLKVAKIRPWDVPKYEGLAAGLTGRFFLEEDATIPFTVYSAFGGVLRIDARNIATMPLSRDAEPDGWKTTVSVPLSAGPHDVELITQGNRDAFKAGLMWTAPGEQVERHMTAADFTPAPRAQPLALTSEDRSRQYPLLRLTRIGQTGLRERARYWAKLQSVSGPVTWELNGDKVQGSSMTFCAPPRASVQLKVSGETVHMQFEKQKFSYLGGSLDVLAQLPQFLYQKEQLQGRAVLLSSASRPLDLTVEVRHMRKHKILQTLVDTQQTLQAAGNAISGEQQTSTAQVLDFNLDGGKVDSGDHLTFQAYCLPESFLDEQIKVITPLDCAGVQCDEAGRLRDAAGNRVLVRLTRPSLGEKRRWGVLKQVFNALRPPSRLLILGSPEEWGGRNFIKAVKAQTEARGHSVHVEPWVETAAGIPRLLGSVGKVAALLQSGEYDGLLFLPPLADLAEGSDSRSLARAAACLTEMAAARLGRKRIWLALPPAFRPDTLQSRQVEQALREVIRDYGIHPLPLATWLESMPEARKVSYEKNGILQSGPVGMYDEVAAYLINWIYGDL